MRWLVIGDVGAWHRYHVGDEAMTQQTVNLVRKVCPSARIAVVSGDPAFTSALLRVESVPRLGFDGISEDEREALLESLSQDGDRSPPAFSWLAGPGDGLIIAGGGNLNSAWPAYIFERLALARRARDRRLPVVVTGQTIGPYLTDQDKARVGEILHAACWVGVRDTRSLALARELGVKWEKISYQCDDAAYLELAEPAFHPPEPEWIAVTLHSIVDPHGTDHILDDLARSFQNIVDATGCRMVFIPHAPADNIVGARWSDEDMGEAIVSRMTAGAMTVRPIATASDTAAATAGAAFIISSRYHPLVFGLAAGIPCFALWSDEYTRIKLESAMAHYGRARDGCDLSQLGEMTLDDRVLARWQQRNVVRAELQSAGRGVVAAEVKRRIGLISMLKTGSVRTVPPHAHLPEHMAGALLRAEAAAAVTANSVSRRHDAELAHFRQASEAAVEYAKSLEQHLAVANSNAVETLRQYEAELAHYRQAGEAAVEYAKSLEQHLALANARAAAAEQPNEAR